MEGHKPLTRSSCANSLAKLRHMFDDDNFESTYVETPDRKVLETQEGSAPEPRMQKMK
jgi:hypothetical protein